MRFVYTPALLLVSLQRLRFAFFFLLLGLGLVMLFVPLSSPSNSLGAGERESTSRRGRARHCHDNADNALQLSSFFFSPPSPSLYQTCAHVCIDFHIT